MMRSVRRFIGAARHHLSSSLRTDHNHRHGTAGTNGTHTGYRRGIGRRGVAEEPPCVHPQSATVAPCVVPLPEVVADLCNEGNPAKRSCRPTSYGSLCGTCAAGMGERDRQVAAPASSLAGEFETAPLPREARILAYPGATVCSRRRPSREGEPLHDERQMKIQPSETQTERQSGCNS